MILREINDPKVDGHEGLAAHKRATLARKLPAVRLMPPNGKHGLSPRSIWR
jgi:hypothetical protein